MTVAHRLPRARRAALLASATAVATSCALLRGNPEKAADEAGYEHCNALMVDELRARKTSARVAVRDSAVVVTLRASRRRAADAAFSGDSAAAWVVRARSFVEDTLPVVDLDGIQVESPPLVGSSALLVLAAARCYAPGPSPDTVWHSILLRRTGGDTLISGGISADAARTFLRALDSAATLVRRQSPLR